MDWAEIFAGHRAVIDFIEADLTNEVDALATLLIERISAGNKILLCGNGGSAADAQHFAAELVNRFLIDSRAWPALSLTTDSSILTSVANDYAADQIFAKQVEAFGRPGDVLILISTSGNSPNLVAAIDVAKKQDVTTVGLLGKDGGTLAPLVDTPLVISCTTHVPRIQEGHLLLIHALCEQIEETLHAQEQ